MGGGEGGGFNGGGLGGGGLLSGGGLSTGGGLHSQHHINMSLLHTRGQRRCLMYISSWAHLWVHK